MSDTPHNPLADYHARTRHHFNAYAEGPGQLDWDAQPAPFRHYHGAPLTPLALSGERWERPFAELHTPRQPPAPLELATLGALLEHALAISAWKSWGPQRWALRCNPSSGNLHPVEAYVLSAGLPGLSDGLHHYDPETHQLESRALRAPDGQRWLAIGLSSVMWREAWKYGERAFRYCQLDVGHALGALAYAARLLGWQITPLSLSSKLLATLLGLDRTADFPSGRTAYTELEEPEILVALQAPGLAPVPLHELEHWLTPATWHGQPSQIDPHPGYRWPLISRAASNSRAPSESDTRPTAWDWPTYPPLAPHATPQGAGALIRQRRSAQRFDPHTQLPARDFYRLLDACLPRPQAPFDAQEAAPAIQLLLFVQRVESLPCGLYLLPRGPADTRLLERLQAAAGRFPETSPVRALAPECPAHLDLHLLGPLPLPELQRLSRALNCHQDIASTSAFALGMLADFSTLPNAYAYRCLLREAGMIGQALYLEAEAIGQRGTGIGCFFDDPFRECFGLTESPWQSVYHFTLGTPVIDPRIETSPPYPHRDPPHEP